MTLTREPDFVAHLFAARPAWYVDAACRGTDPDLWFPPRGGDTAAAKAVCAGCSVKVECLDFALGRSPAEKWGIWGGTSERERRRLRHAMRRGRTA